MQKAFVLVLCWLQLSCTIAVTLPTQDDLAVTGLEEIEPAFGAFDGNMFAGRIPFSHQGKMMFWLYESLETKDLVIWLNGGPGCSSLGGMLFETSPVTVPHYESGFTGTVENPPLQSNAESWTRYASMLYVEQPAGTGFTVGQEPQNETDVAKDFHSFLANFYRVFPQFLNQGLYIFGESYAGMYVPSIAIEIHRENTLSNKKQMRIPIKGIGLGNGWIDATVQGPAVIDYAWWHGMIDLETKTALHEKWNDCYMNNKISANMHPFTVPDECGIMEVVQKASGRLNDDLMGPNIYDVTTWDGYPFIFSLNGTLSRFFNSPEVQDILHAPNVYWSECIPGSGRRRQRGRNLLMLDNDQPVSMSNYIAELLDDAQIRVLVYNGDRDMSCCVQGSELVLDRMNWTSSREWRDSATRGVWLVNNSVAGYARTYANLDFVVVYNSGHLVPMNQPRHALDLIGRMVNGTSFVDQELPVYHPTRSHDGSDSLSTSVQDSVKESTPQPQPHRRHTALLVLFTTAVGFAFGLGANKRYTLSARRQDYDVVPDGSNGVETTQYPWRWWTQHRHGPVHTVPQEDAEISLNQ